SAGDDCSAERTAEGEEGVEGGKGQAVHDANGGGLVPVGRSEPAPRACKRNGERLSLSLISSSLRQSHATNDTQDNNGSERIHDRADGLQDTAQDMAPG